MEVTGKGTLGSAPRCPQAVPFDCCRTPGAARQRIGIEPGNGRGEKDSDRERGICKERHSDVEQCRGKERRTEGDTEKQMQGDTAR